MNRGKPDESAARGLLIGWIFLGIVILFIVFVRVRLLEVPLERDEGEYAYMGKLLLDGVPPYGTAYNMKFPGVYLAYALIMAIFGQTIRGIHMGLLIVNCATVLLIFFLCKRIVNDLAAFIASGAYAILSLSASVLGFAAHATHFVALAAVAGSYFLLNAMEKNKTYHYALSGFLFGIAFLMKQPGIFFIGFGVSFLAIRFFSSGNSLSQKERVLHLSSFLAASLLPLFVSALWLLTAGVFDKFWFWTVQYAAKYGTQIPLAEALEYFKYGLRSVTNGFWLLWIVSALGLLVTVFHNSIRDSRLFIVLFIIFSFLSICPGFYFREHYFITLLPAVSIAIGIFFNYLATKLMAFLKTPQSRLIGIGAFVALALVGINDQKAYLLTDDPVTISNNIYGDNPFDESIEIARFLNARCSPTDTIAVFGSEPQIYFYANNGSATGYIYTYGLMELHSLSLSMQTEMIREIESAKPRFIVDVHISTSWGVRPESEMYIFGWMNEFLKKHYTLVGVVDVNTPGPTVYKWFDEIKSYKIQLPSYVLIYERVKNNAESTNKRDSQSTRGCV